MRQTNREVKFFVRILQSENRVKGAPEKLRLKNHNIFRFSKSICFWKYSLKMRQPADRQNFLSYESYCVKRVKGAPEFEIGACAFKNSIPSAPSTQLDLVTSTFSTSRMVFFLVVGNLPQKMKQRATEYLVGWP